MSDSTSSADQGADKGFMSNLMGIKTPGVKNIEAAYSRAGASNHHTPGAATSLGTQDQTPGSEGPQGVGSEKFKEGFSDQRQEPTVIGKMFNNMINGTDKTK